MADWIIPRNVKGNHLTPIEASTRVPLLIWAPGEGRSNRHHPHFYAEIYENGPRKAETRAVRFSRRQLVRKGPHKIIHNLLDGTLLPETSQESFTTTVFNLSGYIPAHAVDPRNESLDIIEVTPEMRAHYKEPGILTMEGRRSRQAEIGQFLMSYAIWQDAKEDVEDTVSQFLSLAASAEAGNELAQERRLRLGMRLIGKSIEWAVDPLNSDYNVARKNEALKVGAPVCAWLAVNEFIAGHEYQYFDELETKLSLEMAA